MNIDFHDVRLLFSAKSRMGMASGSFEESMSTKGSSFSASGAGSAAAGAAAGESLVQMKPQRVSLNLRMSKYYFISFYIHTITY